MLGRYTVMCRVPYYAPCLPVFCCCRSFLFVCCIGLYAGHPYIHWIHLKSFYFACWNFSNNIQDMGRAIPRDSSRRQHWTMILVHWNNTKFTERACFLSRVCQLYVAICLVLLDFVSSLWSFWASAASMWELHACMSTVTTLTLLFFCHSMRNNSSSSNIGVGGK